MALFGGGAVALAQPGADDPGPTNEDQAARVLFQSAREAFAVGEYERALSGFQQAYDLSRRPALLYNIGTTLDRLRRDDEALAIFEQFLREDPETPNRAEIESRVAQLRAGIQARHAREEAARLEAERVDAERRAAEEERRLAEEHHRLAEEAASGGAHPALIISVGGVAVATGAMALGFGLRTRALDDSYEGYIATTDAASEFPHGRTTGGGARTVQPRQVPPDAHQHHAGHQRRSAHRGRDPHLLHGLGRRRPRRGARGHRSPHTFSGRLGSGRRNGDDL
ncbi:MAG: tetratricopeptide repeat protein [Sandaracinaceae bacterium]|nr:tetratricopeptide repeat protein [Sandaracinaceae bacterium]